MSENETRSRYQFKNKNFGQTYSKVHKEKQKDLNKEIVNSIVLKNKKNSKFNSIRYEQYQVTSWQ
jgi:hypothetical protein